MGFFPLTSLHKPTYLYVATGLVYSFQFSILFQASKGYDKIKTCSDLLH
jgi:hypothetical protein